MNLIGITGGIGSGKSIVARVLRCNGFSVYDCDSRAKEIMNHDPEIKSKIIEKVGEDAYSNEDGKLNRKFLAEKIFFDFEIREFINRLIHKAVREDLRNCLREQQSNESVKREDHLFFVESAILATAQIATWCDKIWIVTCNIKKRIDRILHRDNLNKEEIEKRLESQNRELILIKSFDNIIELSNNENDSLLKEILELVNKNNFNQTYQITC